MAPLRYEALITGTWATVFSVSAVIVAFVFGDPNRPGLAAAVVVLVAVVWRFVERRERRKMAVAPPVPPGTEVDDLRGVAMHEALTQTPVVLLLLLVLAAVPEAGLSLAVLAFIGAAQLVRYQWLRDYERRRGYLVCRVRGFAWSPRYALTPLKDTAAAQRNLAHAESPAARRAP